MNTPISFKLAKRLKEKEYNESCPLLYNERGGLGGTKMGMHGYPNNYSDRYAAPTVAQVVMWLYEKYDIWIVVNFANKNQWYFDCNKVGFDGKDKRLFQSNYDFDSPEEAYEAAIEYTLDNLI